MLEPEDTQQVSDSIELKEVAPKPKRVYKNQLSNRTVLPLPWQEMPTSSLRFTWFQNPHQFLNQRKRKQEPRSRLMHSTRCEKHI